MKEGRTNKKAKSKKTVTLPKLKAKLQEVFNEYIRLRDKGERCISCGLRNYSNPNAYLQAGHYYPVSGYDGLRFDEDNVHGECARCNCFDESHLIGYGENLIKKIGQERYDALKQRAADYKKNGYKWSRAELLEKIEYYKAKIKELSK